MRIKIHYFVILLVGLAIYVLYAYYHFYGLNRFLDSRFSLIHTAETVEKFILCFEKMPDSKSDFDEFVKKNDHWNYLDDLLKLEYKFQYKEDTLCFYIDGVSSSNSSTSFLDYLINKNQPILIYQQHLTVHSVFKANTELIILFKDDEFIYDQDLKSCIVSKWDSFRRDYMKHNFGIDFSQKGVLLRPSAFEEIFIVEASRVRFFSDKHNEKFSIWSNYLSDFDSNCKETLGDNFKFIFSVKLPITEDDFWEES